MPLEWAVCLPCWTFVEATLSEYRSGGVIFEGKQLYRKIDESYPEGEHGSEFHWFSGLFGCRGAGRNVQFLNFRQPFYHPIVCAGCLSKFGLNVPRTLSKAFFEQHVIMFSLEYWSEFVCRKKVWFPTCLLAGLA